MQGFSKCGWATDYEYKYTPKGYFDYMLIKEMQIVSLSLVSSPANGVPFEKMQEIKNATQFVKNHGEEKNEKKSMFK